MDLEKLKYPIGKPPYISQATPEARQQWIQEMSRLPSLLEKTLAQLSDEQLDTPYRPGGWSVRQVVHHLADSHLQAFSRLKFVLAEGNTTIKPYDEAAWAALSDSTTLPVAPSLQIIGGLHLRMVHLFQNMSDEDFTKAYHHPGYGKDYSLDAVLALYTWHGKHHLAHITELVKREGW